MVIEANWHDDGHVMHLELVKSEAQITSVTCPGGECAHDETECVVKFYLDVFGLECNVGVCDMASDIPFAWAFIGRRSDLDACQLWVIPRADPFFQAWALSS